MKKVCKCRLCNRDAAAAVAVAARVRVLPSPSPGFPTWHLCTVAALQVGRLTLVDLGGEQSATMPPSPHGRAQEAYRDMKTCNQSLLTLNRVIQALAKHETRIPYRFAASRAFTSAGVPLPTCRRAVAACGAGTRS
jgi:hypothetical protein